MIEVRNLSKDYGPRRAINQLNFSVGKGEVIGFLGPNGAGKSTTMKIITGFMAPTSGEARVSGFDVFENPIEVKRRIGYLPETPPVYGEMFVRDYLEYVARLKLVPKDKIKKHVEMALEKTHLGQVQKRLIQNLSKGFKQRVGIAQAIVSDPEVLILDEPTVGLDPKQVAEIRDLINSLRGHHTIILSTHILSEVEATCEKVIIINQGRIVAEDNIKDLSKYSQAQGELFMRVRKPSADLKEMLTRIAGVLSVESDRERGEVKVRYQGQDDVIDSISAQIVNAGLGLVELTPTKINLEDVFLKLTYGESKEV